MTRYCLLIGLLMCMQVVAQQTKDNGHFIEYKNPFWNDIKKGIAEYEKPAKEPRKSFKMDYSGKKLPQSIDEFQTVWCTPPLSQGRTGTCWCFATSSFYESEIHRLTGQKIKLSELYTVYWEYVEKAREYVTTRGTSFFGEGSETNAPARMMKLYGIVPQEVYNGLKDGRKYHDHKGMYKEMKLFLESRNRDNAWNEQEILTTIKSIMNHYIGEPPTAIEIGGKRITPNEYLKNITKLKPDEYVNFMSLLQKPYWTKSEYKVPDNWWRSDDYNNIPLEDFMSALKGALKNGYSLAIGGDVSESGLNSEYEVAMVPTYDIPSEYIDEHARQFRFSNKSTTDDHAIHLIGYKEDGDDTWFLVKDSGSGAQNGKNKGYYFYHEDYIKLKMMTFTVHKDAVKDVLKKMKKSDS